MKPCSSIWSRYVHATYPAAAAMAGEVLRPYPFEFPALSGVELYSAAHYAITPQDQKAPKRHAQIINPHSSHSQALR